VAWSSGQKIVASCSKSSGFDVSFRQILSTRRMLRYAPRFHEKNRGKKIEKKNQSFFGYRGSTANLGYACKNLGCLGPLVWEEILGRSSECCCRVFVLSSAVELYVVKARAQSSWEDAVTAFEGV
jgi:hypothetical protein